MFHSLENYFLIGCNTRSPKVTSHKRCIKLSKFSPVTAEVCEPLHRLTSVKTEWSWIRSYQDLFDRAETLYKKDTCMKFYKKTRLLYLGTDASRVGLGTGLLQIGHDMNCTHDQAQYNVMTHSFHQYKLILCREMIQQHQGRSTWNNTWARKFCHYCFAREVSITADHKPLIAIF